MEFGVNPGETSEDAASSCDGPAVPSGMGAGYYPVFISRDKEDRICRVTVAFHPARATKVCPRFPPEAREAKEASSKAPTTASEAAPQPPPTKPQIPRPDSGPRPGSGTRPPRPKV
ncbi:unnamed protein product [Polarella glacialis]|uniref:Uncharacterized protein n=1 Tax=Polarella glacialis TaxID=89957 RepID=A0A813LMB6_POLGL|nr:unnamed protein product [Polarella glacialis]